MLVHCHSGAASFQTPRVLTGDSFLQIVKNASVCDLLKFPE
jgi:hypothetical protein